MKKRVISGLVLTILLVIIYFVNLPIVDTLFIFLVSALGIYEYNKAFKQKGHGLVPLVGYISCLPLLLIGNINLNSKTILTIITITVPVLLIAMAIYIIILNKKKNIVDVAITLLSIVYIPFLFSFLKYILSMENGRIYILYVILGAFACDTFAFLVGVKFGKHKLSPNISPKKTIEGSIGGILGVIVTYILITIIANKFFNFNMNIIISLISAIIVSVVGQFGDLFASLIKRYCGVKDFGSIMPGHGGVLDRLDSVLFVAPIVYIIIQLCNIL